MQFLKCLISKPGLFEGLELNFSDGLNIITGQSGAGKTFLAKCLMECVWKPGSKDHILDPEELTNTYAEVTFSIKDDIKFTAINNLNKYYKIQNNETPDSFTVYSEQSADYEITEEPKKDDNFLKFINLIKRIDLTTFLQSSFVFSPTDDISNNLIGYDNLKNVFLNDTSGFFNYVEKFKNCENSFSITSKIEENETILKDISKKIQLIEIQNSRISKLNNEKQKVLDEIDGLSLRTGKLNKDIELIKSVGKDIDSIDELRKTISELEKEIYEERDKTITINNLKKDIDKQFPQFKGMDFNDSEYLDSLQKIFIEIRNINEQIDSLHQKSVDRKGFIIKALITLNSVALVSAGFSLVELSTLPGLRNRVIAVSAIAALIISFVLFLLYRMPPGGSSIEILISQRDSTERKLKEILQKGNFQLEGYRLNELYEFLLQYFEDYIAFVEINKELKYIEKNLKGDNGIKEVEKNLKVIKKQEKSLQETIEEKLSKSGVDSHEADNPYFIENKINEKNAELAEAGIQIDERKSVLDRIEEEIAQYKNNTDELETLSSMKTEIETQISELNRKMKGFRIIQSALDEAVQNRQRLLISRLIKKSHEIFHSITGNAYISEVDDLCIEKILKNCSIPENLNLSRTHLLLMSIKLALSEFLVDSETGLPLIIDEAYHFLDTRRIERLSALLEEIAAKRQVIILTHHDGINISGNRIELK